MQYAMYNRFAELVREQGIEQAADKALSLGFGAVEFLELKTPVFRDADEALAARAALQRRGLSVACYSVGVTLYGSEAAEAQLMQSVRIAAALGSPYLHHTLFTSYKPLDGVDLGAVLSDVLPRALRVAAYAETLGITCLYEEQGAYFNGIQNFGRFLREMQAHTANVGVCGDFGNILFAGESAAELIRTFAADIKHVHVKDYRISAAPLNPFSAPRADGKYLTEVPLGQGAAESEACMRHLLAAGYHGPLSFELCYPFGEGYEETVKENMAFLNAALRPPHTAG